MNTNDVFVWNDGFWCFREEHSPQLGRCNNYSVLLHDSEEWVARTREPFFQPTLPPSIELRDTACNSKLNPPPSPSSSPSPSSLS